MVSIKMSIQTFERTQLSSMILDQWILPLYKPHKILYMIGSPNQKDYKRYWLHKECPGFSDPPLNK